MSLRRLRAWRRVGQAQRRMAEERFDDALEAAQEAASLAPGQDGVRLQLALVQLDRGDVEAALTTLSAPHDARNPAWPVFEGLAHLDAGDRAQARACLDEALRLAPGNLLAQGLQAVTLLADGKPSEGLTLLDRCGIEASPRLLGRLLVEVERTLIARGEGEGGRLRAASDVDAAGLPQPPEGEAAVPRGAQMSADAPLPWEPTSARVGLLDRIVGLIIDPVRSMIDLARADRAMQAERLDDALAAALAAVRRFPDLPRGFCVLGLVYLQRGDAVWALRALDQARKHDGETPDVLFAQGCCLHQTGDLDNARRRLLRMLELFEKDAPACYTLGQIDLEQGRALQARRWFERAAMLDFLIVRERIDRLRAVLEKDASDPAGTD